MGLFRVGKALKDGYDPSMKTDLDLPAELELVTERSEPKPGQQEYDIGLADFVTRYGAVGGSYYSNLMVYDLIKLGLLPNGTKCTIDTKRVIVLGSTFYSFWKRIS